MNKIRLLVFSVFLSVCHACVQVDLLSIENNGVITDVLGDHDEMKFVFGVSDLFFYQMEKDFARNDTLVVPPSAVSFPCFAGEALWFQAVEIDNISDDIA